MQISLSPENKSRAVAELKSSCKAVSGSHPVLANLFAKAEALLEKYGPSILPQLPALLTDAGCPVWLIPIVVAAVTGLVHITPVS